MEAIVERMRAAAGMSPAVAGSGEIVDLRNEIALAQEGSRQTGQLNPRNPGPLNDAVQFGKKVMRRSLTWYTRPLHLFQGAVIRALQHAGNILDDQRGQLHKHSEALNLHADVMERNKAWLAEQIHSQKSASEQSLERFRQQVDARLTSHESDLASAIDTRLIPLQRTVDALESSLFTRLEEALVTRFEEALRSTAAELAQHAAEQAKHDAEQAKHNAEQAKHNAEQAKHNAEQAQALEHLRSEGHQLNLHVDALRENFNALQATVQQVSQRIHQTSVQMRVRERDLRRLLRVVGPEAVQQMSTKPPPVPPMFPSEIKDELAFDYFAFEEQYRGDEGETRQKQQVYVDYFRDRDNVVDLGCGRGEFLEALRDAGIPARGIELGTDQILLCQEKGLDVVQQDLFAFLESTPDESLGGIFSSQVIEHMTASDQLRYVALAYQKCKPGSPVIFETINPQCVYALVRNFFLDPTHMRPIHPETLQFAMESCDFRNVKLRFSAPLVDLQVPPLKIESNHSSSLEQFNAGIARVNELLYGFQDYAAIGWK